LILPAPAKVNLFLEVPRKRPDGFHELDTVFAALELADEVEVEERPGGAVELEVRGADLPTGPENLAWRAARAVLPEGAGARIRLTKRIPAGGGLGGGSSDAAAVLRALGRDLDDLPARAAELGSDVAFFLRGGTQRGQGRGEVLTPVACGLRLDLVLVFPEFGCPTPAVYRALAPHLPAAPRTADEMLSALQRGDSAAVAAALFNRLEAPAFELYPSLRALKERLTARPDVRGALLSGSGSTLLALLDDARAARGLVDQLAAEGLRAVATRTNPTPLGLTGRG
jgi:4-diphosphocytidyl-2-C-methyl-D-erythritol kinase